MTATRSNASDASYHGRHAGRTLRRAQQIAAHIDGPVRVLDVGCNNGITSRYLLDSGVASHVTGIELLESTVDPALREHPNFRLIVGNIVDLSLDEDFDVVIYGAVHHHILRFNGLNAAVSTLQKLARHCSQRLFFETGQLGEGGRWPWQRAMRRYFRTDEEHFCYLLRSIEDRVADFTVIGRHWIHGIRRWYLRFDIDPEKPAGLPQMPQVEWPADAEGPMLRTFGSRGQQLQDASDASVDDSPTRFWRSDSTSQFFKQHRHQPNAAGAEARIGGQLQHDWAVVANGLTESPQALVFPLLRDGEALSAFGRASIDTRRTLAEQVISIHQDAADTRVELLSGLTFRAAGPLRLVDTVDLNSNNLVVVKAGSADTIRVVDFEQQSIAYRCFNDLHLARALRALRFRRGLAAWMTVKGVCGVTAQLLQSQWLPLETRIRNRRPALLSLLVAEVRSFTGRMLDAILKVFGYGER